MAELLKGAPVAAAILEDAKARADALKARGVTPVLALLRVGERPEDGSYVNGILKKAPIAGVEIKSVSLPAGTDEASYLAALDALNRDASVHGVLMFRPLPKGIDEKKACAKLDPAKDVDGCTPLSLAGVFTDTDTGFCPCTAESALRVLQYYQIPLKGKRAAVVGRSLVIGKPVSMLLLRENATVTTCHSRTENLPAVTQSADIVVAALGKTEFLTAEYFKEGQTVIDVGVGWSETKQKLCGDADFDSVSPVVSALTPVPGGVGAVTTAVLMNHTVTAAERQNA